jgi:predicted phage baseplate assembly protein
MPIRPPVLDDRTFDDLVADVLTRIPAHTPEWTNPRVGDPGRTIVELFAWLTDTLLYRVNLIPERQRLTFLHLLGLPMRGAVPARGLVAIALDDENETTPVQIKAQAAIDGPVAFETLHELTVLPVRWQAFVKRRLTRDEQTSMQALLPELQKVYQLTNPSQPAVPYVTQPVFPEQRAEPAGLDLIAQTVDHCLWIALFADDRDKVRTGLSDRTRSETRLNIGVVPSISVPALFERVGKRAAVRHVWEMSTGRPEDNPAFVTLEVVEDTSGGLTRAGVLRVVLPPGDLIGAPTNDVRQQVRAGVGDRPPRLDDAKQEATLVTWIRLRPLEALQSFSLTWVGINAVEIDQRRTRGSQLLAASNGAADQQMQLPTGSVDPHTLRIEVDEPGVGYREWRQVDDLSIAGRDDGVYTLDAEAGTIAFGNGLRGRIPNDGARVRVAFMRSGGGRAGNLPAGSLKDITAVRLTNEPAKNLKVVQPLPTEGGEDAETLDQAERRIPAVIAHRDRAVTENDFRQLAREAPGVRVSRVEVLPRFKPQQRRSGVPGVVSVIVLPQQDDRHPPNPRPDRPFLERMHAYLDARRPIATELYTIGCEYVPIAVSIGVSIDEGAEHDTVLTATREALRRFLWPLAPGGPHETGWPLGKSVRDREIEVEIARVPGVIAVQGVNLFSQLRGVWRLLSPASFAASAGVEVRLERWQLPELLTVVVVADAPPPTDIRDVQSAAGLPGGGPPGSGLPAGIPIPVVPEVC